jgi:hypothetical protein
MLCFLRTLLFDKHGAGDKYEYEILNITMYSCEPEPGKLPANETPWKPPANETQSETISSSGTVASVYTGASLVLASFYSFS